jgi:hypothetical protein
MIAAGGGPISRELPISYLTGTGDTRGTNEENSVYTGDYNNRGTNEENSGTRDYYKRYEGRKLLHWGLLQEVQTKEILALGIITRGTKEGNSGTRDHYKRYNPKKILALGRILARGTR